jgi:dihydroxyacetone kinase-like predicted kinase
MREQHTKQVIEQKNRAEKTPEKKYGFVAVGAGEGIVGVYKDLGVDVIVEGGQTMNPSTQDILAAVEEIPAEVIFVLPNNKNIVLAAQQTVEMTEKKIIVIPTASIPQGISAMLAFNPEASDEENNENMTDASKNVSTGSITYAARDSEFDGHSIKQGQYLALCENKLAANGTELSEVARVLINDMGVSEKNFVTVFYGEGVSEEDAAAIEALCRESSPDAEIMLLYGGQPVYYYIISAE